MRNAWLNFVVGCAMVCLSCGLLFSQQPDTLESLLASAQQAQARSDFQSAARFYKQAASIHPEIPELRANLGLMYYQMGQDEEAVLAFREAIRLKPALFVPNLFLGLDYIRLNHSKEAVPYLKRAALSNPNDVQTHLGLGQAYAETGDTRGAIASYLHATEVAPENADAWYHLGVSCLDQVEADARNLLSKYKESGYLEALVADNLFDQKSFARAEEAYKKALTPGPFPAGTHARYGFVLIHERDLPSAERELKAELTQNPGSLIGKLGVARLQVEQGVMEQAANGIQEIWKADSGFFQSNILTFSTGMDQPKRAELQRVLEEKQVSGEVSEQVVSLLRTAFNNEASAQGLISNAQSTQETGRSTNSSSAATLYGNGEYRQCTDQLAPQVSSLAVKDIHVLVLCAYSTGDYSHAFQAAKKLATHVATEPEGLYWEIKSAQKLATQALGQASALDSGSPKLHVLLGDLYRQRKLLTEAEQEYRKALALQPNDPGALFGLSLTLFSNNQMEEAHAVAQQGLKNNPDDPELNAVMGEILYANDDFSGAEIYLKKSLNTKPEYVSHVHALLGGVYAKTNRTQEAITELKLALANDDDKDGRIHYQIARLYLKVGDHDSAQKAFEISDRLRNERLNESAVAVSQDISDDKSQ